MNKFFEGVKRVYDKCKTAIKGTAAATTVGFVTAPMQARAAIDTADILLAITAAGAAAAIVGLAWLVAIISVKAFKIIRAAM